MLRQPIVTFLGHVDHGKTTILDRIRKTSVQRKEAGGITQHIGATEVPVAVIEKVAEQLSFPVELRIPGLLFIDTPGHEAFANLRRRGGSIADFAVLVVDINEGFMPQTYEALDILREYRVPFLVAANKIDAIRGWNPVEDSSIRKSLSLQSDDVLKELDGKIYDLVVKLGEQGFNSERFDRVRDFTKEVIIVPVSGKTGEGIPELLLYVAGLTQKYLEKRLETSEGPGKASILEIKEEQGIGATATVILYEGVLRKGDTVSFLTLDGPVTSRVKAIFRPKPLDEIRNPREKFTPVDMVRAAAGVKVSAPGIERAIPGSPFLVGETVSGAIDVLEKSSEVGVILKADTLGSLEAIVRMLQRRGIPVKKASIGNVSKKDVAEASVIRDKDRYLGVILAFNVDFEPGAEEEAFSKKIPVLRENVIYRLLDMYDSWRDEEREREKREKLEGLVLPGKIYVLPGYVFRRSDPAIVGVKVLGGVIKPKYPLMRDDGVHVGEIRSIQKDRRSVQEAKKGDELAVAIHGPLVGRHFCEGDVLYTDIPKEHIKKLKRYIHLIPSDYAEILKEIEVIKKKGGLNEAGHIRS